MDITPEILRDYLAPRVGEVVVAGDTRLRFSDVLFPVEGEPPAAGTLYLLPEYDESFPGSALVPAPQGVPAEAERQPPPGACVIFAPCAAEELWNLIRGCFSTYEAWFRGLYEAIARGDSMESIIESCYPYLKNPVFIDDSSYRTLARMKDYSTEKFRDEEYIFMQKNGHHSPDYIYAMLNSDVAVESSAISPRPLIHRFEFLSHRTLYSTIKVNGEIVGFFSCLELETEFTGGLIDIFESLTELMSLALGRDTRTATGGKSLDNDLFLGILNGGIDDEEMVAAAVSRMGLAGRAYFVAYITTDVDTAKNAFLLPRIMELLGANLSGNCFAVADGANIILVVRGAEGGGPASAVKDKLVGLIGFYLREYEVQIGLSLESGNPRQIAAHYEQARAAVRLGPLTGGEGPAVAYSDVVGYHMAERFDGRQARRALCHPGVFALLRHDEGMGTSLLPTLRAYAECMGDAGKAAKQLFLHRNTMYYRLRQMEELTGLDFKNTRVLFHVSLTFLVMELDGYIGE